MAERNFREMLEGQWAQDHFVCVGLDSDYDRIPESARQYTVGDTILVFNCRIINATLDLVCAYKPNIAFYEAQGPGGMSALIQTTAYIRETAPEVPIILDAKRADIGNTNRGYIQAAFDILGVDAVTVHPYLGAEALQPFLERGDKGIIVLCRTSNPGAGELQDLEIHYLPWELKNLLNGPARSLGEDLSGYEAMMPLYQHIAHRVANHWDTKGNCALVVGATYPEELQQVREIVGNMPILIPGVGKQGGDVEKTVAAGVDSRKQGMIINSSRGIIFASDGPDFAEAARQKVIELSDMINQCRQKVS